MQCNAMDEGTLLNRIYRMHAFVDYEFIDENVDSGEQRAFMHCRFIHSLHSCVFFHSVELFQQNSSASLHTGLFVFSGVVDPTTFNSTRMSLQMVVSRKTSHISLRVPEPETSSKTAVSVWSS